MLNQQKNLKNRSRSKFLVQRRKRNFQKDFKEFSKKNNASYLGIISWDNTYRCIFQSECGKNAFAWGRTRSRAFYNMVKMFNLKYSAV